MAVPRTRSTGQERRVEVPAAALSEFALGGLHGTSTEAIAKRAGISHAYLFRLFGTEKQLSSRAHISAGCASGRPSPRLPSAKGLRSG